MNARSKMNDKFIVVLVIFEMKYVSVYIQNFARDKIYVACSTYMSNVSNKPVSLISWT